MLDSLKKLYAECKDQVVEDFLTLLRFQSISSESEYKDQMQAALEWVKRFLEESGFTVEIWPTAGHPTLFATWLGAGPDKPTVMIYNHYDVQPVDPIEEWSYPPFEPTIKDNTVYARGAQDNKGQCSYVIQALRALLRRDGKLPVNVKLCIEGEEEIGSSGLTELLKNKSDQLKADYLIVADLDIPSIDVPAISMGVRGIVTMDVEATCSSSDLHSGVHGGIAYNPIHALVNVLASLRDEKGKITIPGFYDAVKEITQEEKESLYLDFDEADYMHKFGTVPTGGEQDYSPGERAGIRPALEINGIKGGYTGNGFKTVIPAKASAKISCRLVPHQEPGAIGQLVARHIESLAPRGVHIQVSVHPGCGTALRAQAQSQIVQAMKQAYEEVFQKPARYIYQGGSIPVVAKLAEASGSEVILMGLGLPTDNIHAPNEHFGLDRLEKGFLVIGRSLEILSNFQG